MQFQKIDERKLKKMNEELTAEEFGDYVKFMRQSIDLTQREFSYALGINKGLIVKWEQGKSLPHEVDKIIRTIKVIVRSRIKHKGA